MSIDKIRHAKFSKIDNNTSTHFLNNDLIVKCLDQSKCCGVKINDTDMLAGAYYFLINIESTSKIRLLIYENINNTSVEHNYILVNGDNKISLSLQNKCKINIKIIFDAASITTNTSINNEFILRKVICSKHNITDECKFESNDNLLNSVRCIYECCDEHLKILHSHKTNLLLKYINCTSCCQSISKIINDAIENNYDTIMIILKNNMIHNNFDDSLKRITIPRDKYIVNINNNAYVIKNILFQECLSIVRQETEFDEFIKILMRTHNAINSNEKIVVARYDAFNSNLESYMYDLSVVLFKINENDDINNCVNEIFNQNIKNTEIIIVSPDIISIDLNNYKSINKSVSIKNLLVNNISDNSFTSLLNCICGKYVSILSSTDEYKSNALDKMLMMLNDDIHNIVISDYEYKHENENVNTNNSLNIDDLFFDVNDNKKDKKNKNSINRENNKNNENFLNHLEMDNSCIMRYSDDIRCFLFNNILIQMGNLNDLFSFHDCLDYLLQFEPYKCKCIHESLMICKKNVNALTEVRNTNFNRKICTKKFAFDLNKFINNISKNRKDFLIYVSNTNFDNLFNRLFDQTWNIIKCISNNFVCICISNACKDECIIDDINIITKNTYDKISSHIKNNNDNYINLIYSDINIDVKNIVDELKTHFTIFNVDSINTLKQYDEIVVKNILTNSDLIIHSNEKDGVLLSQLCQKKIKLLHIPLLQDRNFINMRADNENKSKYRSNDKQLIGIILTEFMNIDERVVKQLFQDTNITLKIIACKNYFEYNTFLRENIQIIDTSDMLIDFMNNVDIFFIPTQQIFKNCYNLVEYYKIMEKNIIGTCELEKFENCENYFNIDLNSHHKLEIKNSKYKNIEHISQIANIPFDESSNINYGNILTSIRKKLMKIVIQNKRTSRICNKKCLYVSKSLNDDILIENIYENRNYAFFMGNLLRKYGIDTYYYQLGTKGNHEMIDGFDVKTICDNNFERKENYYIGYSDYINKLLNSNTSEYDYVIYESPCVCCSSIKISIPNILINRNFSGLSDELFVQSENTVILSNDISFMKGENKNLFMIEDDCYDIDQKIILVKMQNIVHRILIMNTINGENTSKIIKFTLDRLIGNYEIICVNDVQNISDTRLKSIRSIIDDNNFNFDNIIKETDIVLFPSIYNENAISLCSKVIKYGCIVITTFLNSAKNLILNNYNGIIVPPNAYDISNALREICLNHELRKNILNNSINIQMNRKISVNQRKQIENVLLSSGWIYPSYDITTNNVHSDVCILLGMMSIRNKSEMLYIAYGEMNEVLNNINKVSDTSIKIFIINDNIDNVNNNIFNINNQNCKYITENDIKFELMNYSVVIFYDISKNIGNILNNMTINKIRISNFINNNDECIANHTITFSLEHYRQIINIYERCDFLYYPIDIDEYYIGHNNCDDVKYIGIIGNENCNTLSKILNKNVDNLNSPYTWKIISFSNSDSKINSKINNDKYNYASDVIYYSIKNLFDIINVIEFMIIDEDIQKSTILKLMLNDIPMIIKKSSYIHEISSHLIQNDVKVPFLTYEKNDTGKIERIITELMIEPIICNNKKYIEKYYSLDVFKKKLLGIIGNI